MPFDSAAVNAFLSSVEAAHPSPGAQPGVMFHMAPNVGNTHLEAAPVNACKAMTSSKVQHLDPLTLANVLAAPPKFATVGKD